MRHAVTNACALALALLLPAAAHADGGALILATRAGPYRIAVFTQPTPLRAGPADISVLVQNAVTGEPCPHARVRVDLEPVDSSGASIHSPATREAATNKLDRSALVTFPQSGSWNATITIDGDLGHARATFPIQVSPPLPPWRALWSWIAFPALPILIYAAHLALLRHDASSRERRQSISRNGATSSKTTL